LSSKWSPLLEVMDITLDTLNVDVDTAFK
ncbi:hypothetical protein B0G83_1121, partial [Paraburkholderia sp. BL21I4N1]